MKLLQQKQTPRFFFFLISLSLSLLPSFFGKFASWAEERRHEAEVLRRFVREREFTRYLLENLGRKMGENACFFFFSGLTGVIEFPCIIISFKFVEFYLIWGKCAWNNIFDFFLNCLVILMISMISMCHSRVNLSTFPSFSRNPKYIQN